MIESLIEGTKFIGGIGGIASAVFLIYDRYVSGRPLAYLNPEGSHAELVLKNVTEESIVIDEISVTPRVLQVSMADDLRSTIKAVVAGEKGVSGDSKTYFVISAEGERRLPLVFLSQFKESPKNKKITITCGYRNTRRPLPFSRFVKVKTTIEDLEAINCFRAANQARAKQRPSKALR